MKKITEWDIIEKGDRVRSFDFENNDDCFVDGRVVNVEFVEGCIRYVIAVERCIFDGGEMSEEHTPDFIYPPVNGTPTMFSSSPVTHLVRKLGV